MVGEILMSNSPIADFMMRMQSFRVSDVAVLFSMVALQEMAMATGCPISPAARERTWGASDLSKEEHEQAVQRLMENGELVWVEEEMPVFGGVRGYRVTRFDELRKSMAVFGAREYQREYQRKRREKLRETA